MKVSALLVLALISSGALAQDAASPPAAAAAPVTAPVAVPPVAATQNTITTTAPVSSETTISVGSWASAALQWAITAFSVPIGTLLTAWLYRLFKLAGVKVSDDLRDKLQQVIVNGLNAAAKRAETDMTGRGKVEIKNEVVSGAVAYAQVHGADTIKALGLDPNSGAAVEAIRARIETAINDPSQPTPAVLDSVAPVKVS